MKTVSKYVAAAALVLSITGGVSAFASAQKARETPKAPKHYNDQVGSNNGTKAIGSNKQTGGATPGDRTAIKNIQQQAAQLRRQMQQEKQRNNSQEKTKKGGG